MLVWSSIFLSLDYFVGKQQRWAKPHSFLLGKKPKHSWENDSR